MSVTIRSEAGQWIVEILSRLDAETELSDRIAPLFEEGKPHIIVDLSRVEMITSAGLSALVELTARANSQGGRLVLASPTPFVQGVLQTTQLDRFFQVFPAVDAAIAGLSV